MNKRKSLIMIGGLILVFSLAFSGFTFAWINYQKSIDLINVNSGSLEVTNLGTNVYKYVYPNMTSSGSDIDYNKDGSVQKLTIGTGSNQVTSVAMNLFDPTLLKISKNLEISDLNTNLVLAISFNLTYSTAVTLKVEAEEVSYSGTSLKASNYVHFTSLMEDEYTSYAATSGITSTDDAKVYDNIKKYSEDIANHPYTIFPNAQSNSGSSSMAILKSGSNDYVTLVTRPANEVTNTFTFYVNVDYDDNLTNGKISSSSDVNATYNLYTDARLGNNYSMVMDYHFILTLSQA